MRPLHAPACPTRQDVAPDHYGAGPAILDTPPDTAESSRRSRRDRPPAADPAHSQHLPLTPGVLLGIVRRHQWLLLTLIVLVPMAAAISLHATTPLYTATGT